jgi:hypothetical protein
LLYNSGMPLKINGFSTLSMRPRIGSLRMKCVLVKMPKV